MRYIGDGIGLVTIPHRFLLVVYSYRSRGTWLLASSQHLQVRCRRLWPTGYRCGWHSSDSASVSFYLFFHALGALSTCPPPLRLTNRNDPHERHLPRRSLLYASLSTSFQPYIGQALSYHLLFSHLSRLSFLHSQGRGNRHMIIYLVHGVVQNG